MCELKSRWYEGTKNQEGPQGPNERWPPQTTSYVVVPFSCTPQTKNTPLFKSPAWGTRKRNNYFCSFCLEYLLGLNREFDKLIRFSSCSIETGRCVCPLLYCRACVPTEPPKSPASHGQTRPLLLYGKPAGRVVSVASHLVVCTPSLSLSRRESHPTCGIYLRLPLHSDWGVTLILCSCVGRCSRRTTQSRTPR